MLPGKSPSIQDDAVFASSSAQRHRVQQKQQAHLTKSHTSAFPDEVCVEVSSECIRYPPDELTKEELDFFLSINFDDDDDTTATTKADNSSFDSSSVRLQQEDYSTSTLQSDTSSISAANRNAHHSNLSFPTLNKPTSTSNGSLSNQVLRGQEIKLVTTMKRSAESREAVQRMGHKIFPASLPNATFSIDTPESSFNQDTSNRWPTGGSITKKRKLEAMAGEKNISNGSAANLALPDKPIDTFSFHLMDNMTI